MNFRVPVLTPDPSSALTGLPSFCFAICRVLAAFHHGHQGRATVKSHGLDRPSLGSRGCSPRREEGAGRAGVLSLLSASLATSHLLSSVLERVHVATFPLLPKNKQTKNTYQIRCESILKALFLEGPCPQIHSKPLLPFQRSDLEDPNSPRKML